ncbi:hypothetical protein [Shewanella surugensis]|uniref:DUF4148 domain-containing protein n=1 Tax=Shewanella surugensis TaxID=212020 RepID=A0ABT0L5R3_9GAMM|nr:hypothetical protein [Shewanella surugensis]MCL1123019.1 hypothetical protein [Shewanella surugensis]
MKVFNFACVLSVVVVSATSIADEIAEQYSMSQHDFSRTRQVNDSYKFDKNPQLQGAITKIVNQGFNQTQHDLSHTYAASPEYHFASNSAAAIPTQLASDDQSDFKQSQHDKSMSDF